MHSMVVTLAVRSWEAVTTRASLGDTATALISLSCAATAAVTTICAGLLASGMSAAANAAARSHTCDRARMPSCHWEVQGFRRLVQREVT